MTYPDKKFFDDKGEISAVFRPVGATEGVSYGPGKTNVDYLATGALTGGQFGLYRWNMSGAPTGPSPHFHRTITESFFVISGTVRLYNGDVWVDAKPGDFLYVPQGGIHAFGNDSGEPASMLILFTPGAPREAYFEALAEISVSGRTATDDEMLELLLAHDQYSV
ncbi:cupin domain-containing protein [Streptosporangiaceae bacterium NEAU-GS5]|nr:cupin domain-containing protein [Streptosporangiaceae bacterium NEAU-GS5]